MFASHAPPTRDLACNPGMCSDWELNRQPFGSQPGTEFTDSHKLELNDMFLNSKFNHVLLTMSSSKVLISLRVCGEDLQKVFVLSEKLESKIVNS